MKKILIGLSVMVMMFTVTSQAQVTIKSQSFQKVVKKKKTKWVKASKVIPGSVVLYVNSLKNKGKEAAQKLTVVNNIPEHMHYMQGSAKCKNKCDITYSVDGGKTFNKPKKLFIKDKKTRKQRRAKASEYTTIKWVVAKLKSGKKTTVKYKARLQ
jgi:uncharacterized repeat protein (TIGR01451 family)